MVGSLSTLAALGERGDTADSRGALERLITAPAGEVLLALIALGLIGYALWRCLQSLLDADAHGTSPKGLIIRGGLMVSAVTHTLLAVFAIRLLISLNQKDGGQGSGVGSFITWLIQQPFGRWLVAILGIVLVSAGMAHLNKSFRRKFHRHFDMAPETQRWAYPICYFGLATRGLVFILMGTLFLIAAWHIAPEQAGGTQEVFDLIQHQIFGRWLLAFVSVGLFAFGLYSLLLSAFRRIDLASKD